MCVCSFGQIARQELKQTLNDLTLHDRLSFIITEYNVYIYIYLFGSINAIYLAYVCVCESFVIFFENWLVDCLAKGTVSPASSPDAIHFFRATELSNGTL